MIDYYGREILYKRRPAENWCDYDNMCIWIKSLGYSPKTDMTNLITNIFLCFENYGMNLEHCKDFVLTSGGFERFDYI